MKNQIYLVSKNVCLRSMKPYLDINFFFETDKKLKI